MTSLMLMAMCGSDTRSHTVENVGVDTPHVVARTLLTFSTRRREMNRRSAAEQYDDWSMATDCASTNRMMPNERGADTRRV